MKPETSGERGLPKYPVESAQVTEKGLISDFNRWREEMRPDDYMDQAILLMPLEMIRELNRQGWPIQPGDLGENVTTSGIDYADFKIGHRYQLGPEVLIQISKACLPCRILHVLPYIGVQIGPEFVKVLKDRRGWYARVLKGGRIRRGDVIRLL
ncbi:MAG: MOSC domain-containing protein [Acidobacteriota bacterium]